MATSALNRRAPSRWTGNPQAVATAAVSRSRSMGQGVPLAGMWVFSRHSSPGRGWWWWAAAITHATSSGWTVPSVSSTAWNWMPALRPPAPFS